MKLFFRLVNITLRGLSRCAMQLKIPVAATMFITLLCVSIFAVETKKDAPATSDTASAYTISVGDLEATIKLLENPEESKKLAVQLKNIIKAREAASPKSPEEKKRERRSINFFKIYDAYKTKIISVSENFFMEVNSLPLSWMKFSDYLAKKDNKEIFISFCLKLIVSVLVAILIWFSISRYIKKFNGKKLANKDQSVSKRIEDIFVLTSLKITPLIGLYGFIYLFLTLSHVNYDLEMTIFIALFIIIIYFALKNIITLFLAPESHDDRVIPVKDELALYLYIWIKRILLFSLWTFIVIIPAKYLNKISLANAFRDIYNVGLLIMLATILAQWKEPIRMALCMNIKDDAPHWQKRFRGLLNYIIGRLYIIIILYSVLLVSLNILDFTTLYNFMIKATMKSVVVIAFVSGAYLFWKKIFQKLFDVSVPINEKYPQIKEQVNRYVSYIGKAGYTVIFGIATIVLLNIWGIDISDLLSTNVTIIKALFRIPIIIIISIVLVQFSNFLITNFGSQAIHRILISNKTAVTELEKRVSTLTGIFKKLVLLTISSITIMMVFAELGFDIKPILTGAGIVGLAVGFGAQNLVKDIISGLFLILENRIRIGDCAIINGTSGLVEQVNLRTTILRSPDGTVHVFPNGTINSLSNMTQEFSFYVFNIGVAYKEDVDKVISTLNEIGDGIIKDDAFKSNILAPLEVFGLDQFGDSAIMIKARIKTLPNQQWGIGREMNKRIKKRFDELGIEIPFPHQTIYFGEASKPISVKLEGVEGNKEEIKKIIKDVMKEM